MDADRPAKRGIDLQRLPGNTLALLRLDVFQRPHVVQTVGEFYQDDANVFDHCEHHFAKAFRLCFGAAAELNLIEFAYAVDDERNFTANAPNQVWTGDITYIATDEGWLYLALVLDLFSRQVVGWSMQPHMQSSLVTDALKMAWFRRHPAPGLIFHSDRGSQYCGHEFQGTLAGYKMKSSMSRKGNCWDNAPTESLWGRLKVGRLYGQRFATRRQAMDEVIDWLTFYNHRRLHSTLGYVSPMQYEKSWDAAQQLKAA